MTSFSDSLSEESGPPPIQRWEFIQQLDKALREIEGSGKLAAVIMVEIASFRQINATFGYEAGDKVLAHVLTTLQKEIKKAKLIYRVGDKSFAICINELNSSSLLNTASNRIQSILKNSMKKYGLDIQLASFVGIASAVAREDLSGEKLFASAEECLEKAAAERSRVFVSDDKPDNSSLSLWRIERALSRAISDEEISIHYQPKICLESLLPCSAEALLRWNSASMGPISPELFIGIAEKSGQITYLTEWLIQNLTRQTKDLCFRNKPIAMSLNITMADLQEGSLLETMESAISLSEFDRQRLTLEVTESALMEDTECMMSELKRLRESGFSTAIDDFGTGYSSLAYFKHIPANELKIDKSFVKTLNTDDGDRKIVRTVLELAQEFGMNTVAEGVENAETLQILRDMGCNYAQGFYFSKPLELESFASWLNKYETASYFDSTESHKVA